MIGSHGLTERLNWNAIHDPFVTKITYISKYELHNSKIQIHSYNSI